MPNFFDREIAERAGFSTVPSSYDIFPRQYKARVQEARAVRSPHVYVRLNGGSHVSGESLFDVVSLNVVQGFEMEDADKTLAFSSCQVGISMDSVAAAPVVGDKIYVQVGVDAVNRVGVFQGEVESVYADAARRAYNLSCFDALRRLQKYPFRDPSNVADATTYLPDTTDASLYSATQIQVATLLGAASVLTHALTGLECYPNLSSNRTNLYDELTALLRAAECRAYLSPAGRLLVTYTDELPLWATALRGDMANPSHYNAILNAPLFTTFHIPLNQVAAVFPERWISHRTDDLTTNTFPLQRVLGEVPATLPIFEFNTHNVVSVARIEDSEIINEVRSRTTPDADTRDFIDLSAMAFEDLEALSFSQLGDSATSIATSRESVTKWGLRWRTYDMGGLAEVPKALQTPTTRGSLSPPAGVTYGRYSTYRGDWSDSQMRARRFPIERIRVTAVGILSLQPFELVRVNLPDSGFNGIYQIEARRWSVGTDGFRTVDTLRAMGLSEQFTALDVREG